MPIVFSLFQRIGIKSYPVYHTVYETFQLVKKYVDPNFTYHLAMAQTVGEIGRKLADSQILPFDFRQYAKDLSRKKEDLVNDFGESMTSHGIKLGKQILK